MSTPAIPLKEFDEEMAATRRVIERVPSDRGEWKPHPKSFPLAHLAQLVATMPFWYQGVLRDTHIDVGGGGGYSFQETPRLLEQFDAGVKVARDALASVVGDELDEPWSLKHGETVLMTAPRGEVARQTLRHLAHHRGQLTVYLRLLDIPVPSVYGPTADEGWGA